MTDEPFDIDAWLTGESLPRLDTEVYLGKGSGKAWGRWHRATTRLDHLRKERDEWVKEHADKLSVADEGFDETAIDAATDEVLAAQQALAPFAHKVTLRAINNTENKKILADLEAHRKESGGLTDQEEYEFIILHRLAVAVESPALGLDGVSKVRDEIGEAQFNWVFVRTLGAVLEGGAVDPDVDFLPERSVTPSTEESSTS